MVLEEMHDGILSTTPALSSVFDKHKRKKEQEPECIRVSSRSPLQMTNGVSFAHFARQRCADALTTG
jgi:hypothetical protein